MSDGSVVVGVMAVRRALHFVFKVGNRFQTAHFFRDVLGMKVQAGADRGWRARLEIPGGGGRSGCVVNLKRGRRTLGPGFSHWRCGAFSFRKR